MISEKQLIPDYIDLHRETDKFFKLQFDKKSSLPITIINDKKFKTRNQFKHNYATFINKNIEDGINIEKMEL